jgi:hypothetical protein
MRRIAMAENRNLTQESGSSNRGFGSMDERKQHDAASKGGQSVPAEERSFSKDRELASEAGRKGGEAKGGSGSGASQQSSGGEEREESDRARGGKGNFAEDRERASEAGREGGKH